MTPEPLKNKEQDIVDEGIEGCDVYKGFNSKDIKSAVEGLIKFHEDRIEKLIKKLETIKVGIKDNQLSWGEKDWMFDEIEFYYESIIAIEYWLEDVI